MKRKTNTYLNFLEEAKASQSFLSKDKTQKIIEHFRPTTPSFSRFAPTTFIADFSTKKYIYLEETCFNMLGYTAKYFLENGFESALSKWHPADFELVNSIVFPDDLCFFKTVPVEEYSDFIISYNYRMRNPKGEYVTLLQRLSFIPGKDGIPSGAVGVLFDITHYKTDHSIIHTIEKVIQVQEGLVNKLVFKKIHPVFEEIHELLTPREIEILQFIAEGLSSKQIAATIGLSINTVYNHRKNMLGKTNCRSSSELIRFATTHALI